MSSGKIEVNYFYLLLMISMNVIRAPLEENPPARVPGRRQLRPRPVTKPPNKEILALFRDVQRPVAPIRLPQNLGIM
jgi:hypothetical protein